VKIKPKSFDELIRERIKNRVPGGFTVSNAAGPKATIRLYDVIGWPWIEAQTVAAQLDEITAEEIEVQIASPGGDVFEGIAIYNALRSHPASITTRVDSMAASIASVIAQAGDHRIMLTGSQMMIHEAWGFAMGFAEDFRQTADILDKQSDIIAAIYAERAGGEAAAFRDLMSGESWFDAAETVDAGLADEIVKPSKVDESPEDRATAKFAGRLTAAVAAAEAVAEETERVVTFRVSQGKPPLSEDAVALLEQLTAATDRLAGVVTSEPEPEAETSPQDEVDIEYLRYVELTQL
jgi:ATP-dependent protease ClpP protease subunit